MLALLILLLGSGWFYWYELRPSKIRKECQEYSFSAMMEMAKKSYGSEGLEEVVNVLYYDCIRKKGLEK